MRESNKPQLLNSPRQIKFLFWLKTDSDIYYHKTNDRRTTNPMTDDTGYLVGGPLPTSSWFFKDV
jgi:hypothetical protein